MKFPQKNTEHKIAVLSDFDGVIAINKVLDALYEEFSQTDWRHYAGLWRKGKISSTEEIPRSLGGVKSTREELEQFVKTLEADSSFTELVQYCRKNNHYLAIVSDGLRWYIEILLRKIGVEGIPIFANEVHFSDRGLSFSFPWFDESTPLTGISKAKIVKRIQRLGYKVFYIGDGLSDLEAAKVADIVFAKDYLLTYMIKENRSVREFHNFKDVVEKINIATDNNT